MTYWIEQHTHYGPRKRRVAENFRNLGKEIDIQIKEAQWNHSNNTTHSTAKHNQIMKSQRQKEFSKQQEKNDFSNTRAAS